MAVQVGISAKSLFQSWEGSCRGHRVLWEFAWFAVMKAGSLCISLLGCHNKESPTRQLKRHQFISSRSWRPEVQDQGVGRVSSFRGLSPGLTDGRLLSGSPQGLPCVLSQSPRPLRWDVDPPWWSHFTLIISFKAFSPKTVAFRGRDFHI